MPGLKGRRTARSRKPSRRDWSRSVESASLRRDERKNAAALAAFGRLDAGKQMALAREIAETRAAELTLAYENVVAVAAGLKELSPRRKKRKWDRSPCVTFVVRRKWKAGRKHAREVQHLPYCLLAYAQVDGRRELCAVPTDVKEEQRYFGGIAHSPTGIRARTPNRGEIGNVCCALRVTEPGGEHLALLSCHHVLSPERQLGSPTPDAGAMVLRYDQLMPIGTAWPLGGQLFDDGHTSLDVQFAEVLNPPALRAALGGMVLSRYVESADEFNGLASQAQFMILASPGNNPDAPLRAQFDRYAYMEPLIVYRFHAGVTPVQCLVTHEELLVFRVLHGIPRGGDSGAPVVCRAGGGLVLVGMHIGGNAQGASFVIPAWYLFNEFNFNLPANTRLRPINP